MHLSPAYYGALQRFVHGSYDQTVGAIVAELGLRPGDRVVEIGCGTGSLSRHLTSLGYEYWGVEPDPERVSAARSANPEANFVQGDAESILDCGLPDFKHAFIHGMVHHIDDRTTRAMLDKVFSIDGMQLVMIEPVLPRSALMNPFGFSLAKLDEGKFVRSIDAMERLCRPYVRKSSIRSLMPRWPVPFMHLKLESPRIT